METGNAAANFHMLLALLIPHYSPPQLEFFIMFNLRTTLLATACVLALGACSDKNPPAAEPAATTPAATEAAPVTPTAEPAAETTPVAPAVAASDAKGAAVVSDCATTIDGSDAMQFNVSSITVPSSCAQFTVNLTHSGQMPVAAMGHNVVISTTADMQGILNEGMGAGVASDYLKAGDTRIIAHTKLIGGGEKASVTFDVGKIKGAGPYEFFCSFPGHSSMMKGTISVG
ncbi:azurin [Thermomonas sp.]|uniref:azurin n=1 Tax=Thermomonas sp. TaxID=1971895 RepID=UPI0031F2E1DC